MNSKYILSCLATVFLSVSAAFASTLANWTFENLTLSTANTNNPSNGWCTNATAEVGSGIASGFHSATAAAYSTPAGNGSAKSLSANNWAVRDFYQFTVSTIGAQNINVSFNQNGSGTGPRDFNLQYSTDGVNFTTFASYSIPSGVTWSSSTSNSATAFSYNLSSITTLTNIPAVYFRVTDASTTSINGSSVGTSGTDRVDNFAVTAATGTPPTISDISPASITTNAGNTVAFKVTLSAGDSPLSYFWYKKTSLTTNLIAGATNATLTFASVLKADTASYQVVVSNASLSKATSSVVTLTVIDPAINDQPVSQQGLLHGQAQFSVLAGGTALSYQWYYCSDPYDNTSITGPVNDGTLDSGAVISGANTSTLTITNLTNDDPANFVVVVTGAYGTLTSSVTTLTVADSGPLAYWDFNDPFLNITNPAPYQGIGTASGMNVSTFLQPYASGNDPAYPNAAWGTQTYPAQGTSNKLAGVQFMVSTVGAKNVVVAFDTRASTTASKFERLQYTTNGMDFIDFPASASFSSDSIYESRSFSLAGFPGVRNNANFGIRMVTEFENTATYSSTNNANYAGVSSGYTPSGTVSYDVVTISADAITDANTPPTVSSIPNQTMEDTFGTNVNFTVGDAETAAGSLSVDASSLDPNIDLSLNVHNTGGSCQLSLSSYLGNSTPVNVPVLVTVTDGDGDSTVTWFTLTINPGNVPPVITGLVTTNMIANGTLEMPFTLTDDHTDPALINPTVFSGNTTLVANDVAHVSLGGSGTSRTLTVTPVTNQLGTVPITVTASDGSKSASYNFVLVVRPSTSVVLNDCFTYDGSGYIVTQSGGFWQSHSGTANQVQAGSGAVYITGQNSEDINAPLIGAPYLTNNPPVGPGVLYSKMQVTFTALPTIGGAYFAHFKDNTIFGFLGRLWASTTNAAAGKFRLGIGNSSATTNTTAQFPLDLDINVAYTVVTRLVLSNAVSTLWINPTNESDTQVTDHTPVTTNYVNIYAYALRQSTGEGDVSISNLVVSTSFNDAIGIAVLDINLAETNAVLTWSSPMFGLQCATNVAGPYTTIDGATSPYTNVATTNAMSFYRLVR